jgi:hypothetical protein
MNKHIHRKKWPRQKKILLMLAVAGVLLVAAAGTTLAWLNAQSSTLTNNFDPAEITCDTDETFTGGAKSNVSICNTGTMDAYIRAALIPVWKDGSSIAGKNATLNDCTMDWGAGLGTLWVLGEDGFYYCTLPVRAGQKTPILIDSCTANANGNYRFELQISAQAVQALPTAVVTQVWSGAVSGVNTDGTLEVK